MDEEALYKRWVEKAGMPREELRTFLTFVKECKLAGRFVQLQGPPTHWNGALRYHPRHPWYYTKLATLNTSVGRRAHSLPVYVEYNWRSKVKPWVVKPGADSRSCYKTVESTIDYVSKLLKSYEECGI